MYNNGQEISKNNLDYIDYDSDWEDYRSLLEPKSEWIIVEKKTKNNDLVTKIIKDEKVNSNNNSLSKFRNKNLLNNKISIDIDFLKKENTNDNESPNNKKIKSSNNKNINNKRIFEEIQLKEKESSIKENQTEEKLSPIKKKIKSQSLSKNIIKEKIIDDSYNKSDKNQNKQIYNELENLPKSLKDAYDLKKDLTLKQILIITELNGLPTEVYNTIHDRIQETLYKKHIKIKHDGRVFHVSFYHWYNLLKIEKIIDKMMNEYY